MPRFLSPRPQQNRPLQQAQPMGAGPNPYQQALSQGKQLAMPQGMGPMGPQQAAPLGAGAGFGAPPTGPQFNPALLQGTPQPMGGVQQPTAGGLAAYNQFQNAKGPNPTTMKKGGAVKKMASGGATSSASKRADGIAQKGKTKGRMC